MHWIILIIAGLLEIFWAVQLKMSQGFSKIVPTILTITGSMASFYFLSLAMKKLPLSISYAIWTGIGIAGTVIFGVFYFHERFDLPHLICISLIVVGIIGLRILD